MVEGHAERMQRLPVTLFSFISIPFSSTNSGSIPGMGKVAKLGLAGVIPARLLIITPPVSVCHQVSTIGQFFLPMCSSYQCHASSLMGSPTVPITLKEPRSLFCNGPKPKAIRLLIAVGAVYKMLTLYLSMISQKRPASGNVGIPSNISDVAPALNGPYTIYECPVIHPISAVQKNISSGWY